MTRHRALPALAVLLGLFAAPAGAQEAGVFKHNNITVTHPWAPPAREGTADSPGYLTITNTGSVPDRLTGGTFIESSHLEITATVGRKSVHSDGIVINPGETVVLKPGGDHLMFVGLKGGLDKGTSPQCILAFDRAGNVLVEFAVEGAPKAAPATAKRRTSQEATAGAGRANGGAEPAAQGGPEAGRPAR